MNLMFFLILGYFEDRIYFKALFSYPHLNFVCWHGNLRNVRKKPRLKTIFTTLQYFWICSFILNNLSYNGQCSTLCITNTKYFVCQPLQHKMGFARLSTPKNLYWTQRNINAVRSVNTATRYYLHCWQTQWRRIRHHKRSGPHLC